MAARRGQRQPLGLHRRKHEQHPCGLCGNHAARTRTHIPPRCAGNRGLVGRRTFVVNGQEADLTKRSPGGLCVYGLCSACNNLQSRYDAAYGELATAVRPLWIRDSRIHLPGPLLLPGTAIQPGAVARSVLIGLLGLSPQLRTNFGASRSSCSTAPNPLSCRPSCGFAWPSPAAPWPGHRVDGRFLSVDHPPDEDAVGIANVGQVYFPPLAWQLAPPEPVALTVRPSKSLLDRQGWADVTSWAQRSPEARVPLSALCSTLPSVTYPRTADWWVEMFSSEITEILECHNVPDAA